MAIFELLRSGTAPRFRKPRRCIRTGHHPDVSIIPTSTLQRSQKHQLPPKSLYISSTSFTATLKLNPSAKMARNQGLQYDYICPLSEEEQEVQRMGYPWVTTNHLDR